METTTLEFKVGDVVECNTHPLPMTVEKVTDAGIECVWFDEYELKRHTYQAAELTTSK